jgi:hypothetical protein
MSAHIPPLWSAERDQIASALFQFQQACPTVPKTETAQIKKDGRVVKEYDYTDLAAAAIYIKPHLAAGGLVWTQDYAGPYVATRIMHAPSGQFKEGYGPMPEPDRKGDGQAWGSLITYMRRYYLLAALGIVAEDEDDDGQNGSATPDPRSAPAARPQQPARASAGERREAPRQAQRAPAAGGQAPEDFVSPMGRSKGQRLGDIDDEGLEWLLKVFAERADDPQKSRYREENLANRDKVRAVLDRREEQRTAQRTGLRGPIDGRAVPARGPGALDVGDDPAGLAGDYDGYDRGDDADNY